MPVRSKGVRIVALGNRDRGDDGAALLVAQRFVREASVLLAGRPGPGLIDFLVPEERCILLDVVLSGADAGFIHEMPLAQVTPELLPDLRVSSHGFGPGEALTLARALGRSLPLGVFLGIEGREFEAGSGLSKAVQNALLDFEERIREALQRLERSGADG